MVQFERGAKAAERRERKKRRERELRSYKSTQTERRLAGAHSPAAMVAFTGAPAGVVRRPPPSPQLVATAFGLVPLPAGPNPRVRGVRCPLAQRVTAPHVSLWPWRVLACAWCRLSHGRDSSRSRASACGWPSEARTSPNKEASQANRAARTRHTDNRQRQRQRRERTRKRRTARFTCGWRRDSPTSRKEKSLDWTNTQIDGVTLVAAIIRASKVLCIPKITFKFIPSLFVP